MVQGTVTGANEFYDFATDIEEVQKKIPEARERAIQKTAQDFIDEVVKNIREGGTAKGGTLNSDSSPYSPGGTNDSTDSKYHIQDRGAWKYDTVGTDTAIVGPKEDVQDRVNWLEEGTDSHGPNGDTPMHFYADGAHIIVTDSVEEIVENSDELNRIGVNIEDQDDAESLQFEHGEPGEVAGVEPQRFFHEAANTIRNNRTLSRHLERQYKRIFDEQF